MPGDPKTWSNTELWKQLKTRAEKGDKEHEAAAEIILQVEKWLVKTEAVLSQAHTDPMDFTLHDKDHAFRVAERMMELVRSEHWQNFSDYEIALLLLAAYLHDIGMSPERKKVESIHRLLLVNASDALSKAEIADIQRWLDENRYDLDLSQPRPSVTAAYLDLADEITTYYVRHKHNDWSKEWIMQNLSGEMHALSDWQEALIRLCQSHHAEHSELRTHDFDSRAVGQNPPQRLHLRQLACILRIADILENSPDRVPKIIFQHRNIASRPKSLIHWVTPHQMAIHITGGTVHVSAEPQEARFEKAIRTLAGDIDKELAGCAAIAKEMPFKYNPVLSEADRDWILDTACILKIHSRGYVFIDGAFRPNTAKLLDLLSGPQIYNTPFTAVRELLQNAFDAVREKIARKRLKLENPTDSKLEEELGKLERVTLILSRDGDGTLRLTCEDTGCGMTKEIIEHHLLVSGDARRPALIELERQCKKAGFSLNRTGQFGIGVLSYFMMAAEVWLTTCRDQLCQDEDGKGWTFSTTGVGDFGELRKLIHQPTTGAGTRIEWRLNEAGFPDAEKLFDELEKYLRQTVIRIPCNLRFQSDIDGKKRTHFDFPTGWTHTTEDIRAAASESWAKKEQAGPVISYTDSAELIAGKQAVSERLLKWNAEALSSLRFSERTLSLPDGCGLMRVILPWFDLSEGRSLVFVLRDKDQGGRLFLSGEALRPDAKVITAWKGMASSVQGAVKPKPPGPPIGLGGDYAFGWITFDLSSIPADQLQVNRASFLIPNEIIKQCREVAMATLAEMVDEIMRDTSQPPYFDIFGKALLNRPLVLEQGPAWAIADKGQSIFASLRLPCVYTGTRVALSSRLIWRNAPVTDVLMIGIGNTFHDRFLRELRPQRIVALNHAKDGKSGLESPAGLWDSSLPKPDDGTDMLFPPEWPNVWGCGWAHNRRLLNTNHWAIRLLNQEQRMELATVVTNMSINPMMVEQVIDPLSALAFLLRVSLHMHPSHWTLLRQNHPAVFEKACKLCSEFRGQDIHLFPLVVFRGDAWHHLTPDRLDRHDITTPSRSHFIPQVKDPGWRLQTISGLVG